MKLQEIREIAKGKSVDMLISGTPFLALAKMPLSFMGSPQNSE
jgi:hypothetical protein